MEKYLLHLLMSVVFITFISFASAQAGMADSSFGINGKVTSNFFSGGDTILYGNVAAVQPDGKLVVAGYFYVNDYHANFVIARYKTNGDLDSSFGDNGKVVTYFTRSGLATTYPKSVHILAGGKILVAGYRVDAPALVQDMRILSQGINRYYVLARFLSDGTPDTTFGTNGQVQYLMGAFNYFTAYMSGVKLLEDSSMVTAGEMNGLIVLKFLSDGTIDSSFATNGKFYDNASGFTERDFTTDQSGRILIAGQKRPINSLNYDFAVRRLSASGKPDSSYGYNSEVLSDFSGGNDTIMSVVATESGSIVTAGTAFNTATNKNELGIAKYKATGDPDSSFGTNGKTSITFNTQKIAVKQLLRQQDEKIVIAMQINDSAYAVLRITKDGIIDNSFGANGFGSINLGTPATLVSALLQTDEKVVVVGRPYFTIARFKGDEPLTISLVKSLSVVEGNTGTTPVQFKVVLNKPSSTDVFVNYTTRDITAIAGSDYISTSGTLRIKAGKTKGTIRINVIGDNTREKTEGFALVLSNPVNAVLGNPDSITCAIKNDDPSFMKATESSDIKVASTKLYPNPVRNELKIVGLIPNTKTIITILDINSKVIYSSETTASVFTKDVKVLKAGTYFVRIEDANHTTEKFKFIKL